MTGSVDEFFDGDPTARQIHDRLVGELTAVEGVEVHVSRSQVAYRLGRTFAIEWRPGRYLRSEVPLVLSLPLRQRLESTRFKQVVQVARGTWMHHLELRSAAEVDDEVRRWIRLARGQAQEPRT
ncbi:DUF5655 domain-containing protein [Nocardioides sp. QY071]|uniref:DUF5655 domain-containing protein n=1 Tax=Nocardioides sp. QY071 TaxID=3044187 RepID=UPI00249A916A|nr:DUF5655 domain-containing protein [Nocardioides sp. QY071]WGY04505.1 DUF5655 domain-containing protein [Nocardioides sp. QY071]